MSKEKEQNENIVETIDLVSAILRRIRAIQLDKDESWCQYIADAENRYSASNYIRAEIMNETPEHLKELIDLINAIVERIKK